MGHSNGLNASIWAYRPFCWVIGAINGSFEKGLETPNKACSGVIGLLVSHLYQSIKKNSLLWPPTAQMVIVMHEDGGYGHIEALVGLSIVLV